MPMKSSRQLSARAGRGCMVGGPGTTAAICERLFVVSSFTMLISSRAIDRLSLYGDFETTFTGLASTANKTVWRR